MARYFRDDSIVLIDTCSLIDASESSDALVRFFSMLLDQCGKARNVKVCVSDGVVKELHNFAGRPGGEDPNRDKKSRRAYSKVTELHDLGQVFFVQDGTTSHNDIVSLHADRFFLNVVNNYKEARNIYVITQDINLMRGIYGTAQMDALAGHGAKEVVVYKIPRKRGVVDTSRLSRFNEKKKGGGTKQNGGHKPKKGA